MRLNRGGDPLDFTNSEAYAWWQDRLRAYTDIGIEGYKLDYAEDLVGGIAGVRLPFLFSDGSTELTMHRGYSLLHHKAYAETLPEDGGFILSRTGRWGEQGLGMVICERVVCAVAQRQRLSVLWGRHRGLSPQPAR